MKLLFEPDDDVLPSPAENLYSLLYELKVADRLADFDDMFNSCCSIDHLIKPNLVALQPLQDEYHGQYSSRCVLVEGVSYLHLSDLVINRLSKRKLKRALERLPSSAFRDIKNCILHPEEECKLIDFQYGLLCFLYVIPAAEPASSVEAGTSKSVESEVNAEEEVHEEVDTIDVEQERVEADQQYFPLISSFDQIDMEADDSALDNVGDDSQRHCELALPQLPYFSMENGFDYVLMSDVTHHFNIREDYCFAALAQFCEADSEFVENICDKYLLIDTDCVESKYQDGRAILEKILNEAKAYERTLPSSEEFDAALRRLGLENMGKEPSQPSDIGQGASSSVPLWRPNMLEDDENQLIYVEEDEFLKRASGTRGSSSSSSRLAYRKDAALKEYLKYLDHTKVLIFHKDFSKDAAKFPLFALKVLTKFCGGYDVPQNADRIVLIERQFALRVFGQGLYCQALRAPYYIAYAAQALILGIADAEQLPVYGKRFLMRSKKLRIAPYMLPLPPPDSPEHLSTPHAPGLQFEETEDEDMEQRAPKRQKPTSSPS